MPLIDNSKNVCRKQIRVLILNDNEHLDSTVHQLDKGWTLEFQLGSTLFGKDIFLFTNHPLSADVEFDRNFFYQLKWLREDHQLTQNMFADSHGFYVRLPIIRAGSFKYYFTDKTGDSKPLGSGYFIVKPLLSVGFDKRVVSFDAIQCQTVLTKSLGPFEEWESRLRVSSESGYNMIHFTPVQELGESDSSYSIKDQLKLNHRFNSPRFAATFDDLHNLINIMMKEWEVLSISDVVLNHTANESPWLLENVECTYNMITAPYLIPAALLDGYLSIFSKEIADGKHLDRGIPTEVCTKEHVQVIKSYLENSLVPDLHLYEFYTCDIDKLTKEFQAMIRNADLEFEGITESEITLINNTFRRNGATVNMKVAANIFNRNRLNDEDDSKRASCCIENFRDELCRLNSNARNIINAHLMAAVENCIADIEFHRVQEEGPKLRKISKSHPLFPRYFTGEFSDYKSVEKDLLERGRFIMAHSGWVINADSLKDFADAESNVFLRRELIPWSDTVKLRYGRCYDDSPFLWDHMRKYVEKTAQIFHGIRLDNCHSTPLPAAEYLIDCARKVRPDLYIAAELFTNCCKTDNIFVNRLGISSLIREAMSAHDSQELGRLVYRYGGEAVGSFWRHPKCFLIPSIPHALFYDVTHDNPSPIEKKGILDSLASSALVSMACSASGSTRGFDEFVPHHINVVTERRLYSSWTTSENLEPGYVNYECGIIRVKKLLNLLHTILSDEGYSQVFVDQLDKNIVAVTRHNPSTHESVILVAHTAFYYEHCISHHISSVKELKVEGLCSEVLLEAQILYTGKRDYQSSLLYSFEPDHKYINGLTEYRVHVKHNINIEESRMLKLNSHSNSECSRFLFENFKPGSIIAFKLCLNAEVKRKLEFLINLRNSLLQDVHEEELIALCNELSLGDLNFVLYRCSEEDRTHRFDSYFVPGYGSLPYCGLQGFVSVLDSIRNGNDLGHPICENLRMGNWALDYISSRLKGEPNTRKLGIWFEQVFDNLKGIPRYLIPSYFDLILTSVSKLLLSRAAIQMSDFVREGSDFVQSLAMGSVQCVGIEKFALLPSLSPSLTFKNNDVTLLTMSAGLPHFSTGYMRSWGRDTFISLRGLLLITGRHELARSHILAYGGCLRHGLIPNLINGGVNARYNCRDAVWWWLYAIVSYVNFVPNGHEILGDPVSRMFPSDDSPPLKAGVVDQPLSAVMQEALAVHFQGLSFRERNAGPSIDANMTDSGFNNRIGVDLSTGFVFGGNGHNCGTWMDKMGSNYMAGNFGQPATPRDGSAVEIVGLSKAVVRQLAVFYNKGWYPYHSVKRVGEQGRIVEWTFERWNEIILGNFEELFWVPSVSSKNDNEHHLIHRRGIYKDCVGSSQPWADYQLRCNFLIALTVAPELADPKKAWIAIKNVEQILLGPLGIRSLDPADWNYNGYYDNTNNSMDSKIANGFNYHQGPEWIWPAGYFLRAKLYFAKLLGSDEVKQAIRDTRSYLGTHYKMLKTSLWRGLPELTNRNGAECSDSCQVQAWSMASILEVLYDLETMNAA